VHPVIAPSPSQFNQRFQTFNLVLKIFQYTKIYRHSQTTILLTSDHFHRNTQNPMGDDSSAELKLKSGALVHFSFTHFNLEVSKGQRYNRSLTDVKIKQIVLKKKSLQETKKLFALFLKINCQKNIC